MRFLVVPEGVLGGVVAFIGFSSAYSRAANDRTLREQFVLWAKQFREWLLRIWRRVFSKGSNQVVSPDPADLVIATNSANFKLISGFRLDPHMDTRRQVDQLAKFVDRLAAQVSALRDEIQRLDVRIDQATADAVQAAAKALADAEARIAQLRAETARSQVLDLRIAIVGIGITVVGLILAYF